MPVLHLLTGAYRRRRYIAKRGAEVRLWSFALTFSKPAPSGKLVGESASSCKASDTEATRQGFELRTVALHARCRARWCPRHQKITRDTQSGVPCDFLVTRGRIELPFQPWEGRVLAAWPTSHICFARLLYHKLMSLSSPFLKVLDKCFVQASKIL